MGTSNRFTISITEPDGARHYELPKILPKLIKFTVMVTVVFLVGAGLTISNLDEKLFELQSRKESLKHELVTLQEEYDTLHGIMADKVREARSLDNKIDSLEETMGVESDTSLSILERVELANMVIARREKEFKEIGFKIENIEDMIGLDPKGTKTLMQRVDMATVNMALKRRMLDSIPNGSPIPNKGLTGSYGSRQHPILNKREFHAGVDLRAAMKTPVKAPADGVVEFAGAHKKSGFGVLLILRHDFGFRTSYGHLESVMVNEGDFVKKGDVVALTGNTGLSSGPHLHYEIRFIQASLDPANFMDWSLANYEVIFEKEKGVKWQSLINLINERLTPPTPRSLQVAQRSTAK